MKRTFLSMIWDVKCILITYSEIINFVLYKPFKRKKNCLKFQILHSEAYCSWIYMTDNEIIIIKELKTVLDFWILFLQKTGTFQLYIIKSIIDIYYQVVCLDLVDYHRSQQHFQHHLDHNLSCSGDLQFLVSHKFWNFRVSFTFVKYLCCLCLVHLNGKSTI